ncbi:CsbD family protein [Leucobacter sp. W1153]|uniref:CsbD family protein n=1 Tax=Leucobacter sp. W1153 TaxID=3439064 RepID=UPI003F307649
MGADDKISAGMDKAKGQAKEAFGKATDNDKLVAEGKMDQAKGDLKNAGENAKDAAKDIFDK